MREAPISWAQQWPWNEHQRPLSAQSPSLYLFERIKDVAGETSIAQIKAAVRSVTRRHPSLRATFRANDDGTATQLEWPAEAEMYEIIDNVGGQGSGAAERAGGRIDITANWPFTVERVGVGEQTDGWAIRAHHIAADRAGFDVFVSELRACLSSEGRGDPGDLSVPGVGSFEIAHFEDSDAGKRLNERAIRHWLGAADDARRISEILCGRFDQPTGQMHVVRGAAKWLGPSLESLSRQSSTTAATVATAVVARTMAGDLNVPRVPMYTMVSNRHIPSYRNGVSTVAQGGMLVVAGDASLEEAIRSATQGTLRAMRNARYDWRELTTQFEGALATKSPVAIPNVNVVNGVAPFYRPGPDRTHSADGTIIESWTTARPCLGFNFHLFFAGGASAVELRVGTHLTDLSGAERLVARALSEIRHMV